MAANKRKGQTLLLCGAFSIVAAVLMTLDAYFKLKQAEAVADRLKATIRWDNPLPIPDTKLYQVPWSRPLAGAADRRYIDDADDRIGFIVMTSSATAHLHYGQRRTCLRGAQHVWAFADEASPLVHTLPSLKGKPTWYDAQHRQLQGARYLMAQHLIPAKIRWLMFIDDDTWVNRFALRAFLDTFNPSPDSSVCGYRYEPNKVLNGGAGILMGRGVFDRIVPKLYTAECPFRDKNDDTLTGCVLAANATLLHSQLFAFYPQKKIDSTNDYIEQITMHPVKDPELMRQMSAHAKSFFSSR